MISRDSGEIDAGPAYPKISPAWDERAFNASAIGRAATVGAGGKPQVEIAPPGLGVYYAVFYFTSGALDFVELTKKSATSTSWETYSQDEELAKQKEYEAILTRALGPAPHAFPWGTAEAVFDPKGGSSFIVVNYEAGRRS